MDEGASADYDEANTMVFASSWTTFEEERIELWVMYTNLKGVRIGLPADMFPVENRARAENDHPRRNQILWSDLSSEQKTKLMLRRRRAASPIAPGEVKELEYALTEIWGPDPISL